MVRNMHAFTSVHMKIRQENARKFNFPKWAKIQRKNRHTLTTFGEHECELSAVVLCRLNHLWPDLDCYDSQNIVRIRISFQLFPIPGTNRMESNANAFLRNQIKPTANNAQYQFNIQTESEIIFVLYFVDTIRSAVRICSFFSSHSIWAWLNRTFEFE